MKILKFKNKQKYKYKKKVTVKDLILLITIGGCSYTPIHLNKEFNFQIDEINFESTRLESTLMNW